MSGNRAAIRYAKAILDIAQANNNTDKVLNDMKTILKAISESNELKNFLENPIVNIKTKNDSVTEIFTSVQNETKGLFQLLLANKRFEILDNITKQYISLYNEASNVENATVTTAFPITADLETKVLTKVKEFSSKNVILTNIIDTSILGGFILRIGDKQYNASVANKLQQLKREFSN